MFKLKKKALTRQKNVLKADSQKASPYSYYARRSPRDSSNREKEDRNISSKRSHPLMKRQYFGLVIIGLLVTVFVQIVQINQTPKVILIKTPVATPYLQNIVTYESAATKMLRSSFANSNKITINVVQLSNNLESQFPEIKNVSVLLPVTGHEVQIYLEPALPALLFNNTKNIYAVDSSGKVIASLSKTSTQVLTRVPIPIISTNTFIEVHLNQQILSSNDVIFMQTVFQQLQIQHLAISSMTLLQGTRELDVLINDHPYIVKFNLESDVNQQVGTYLTVNQHLSSSGVSPAQYIDVRVLGRAFYK